MAGLRASRMVCPAAGRSGLEPLHGPCLAGDEARPAGC